MTFKFLTMGQLNLTHLFNDLEQAKDHIHFQYYIFKLDTLGTRILNVLIQKAKQGVKVRVLFDDIGSRGLRKRHLQELIDNGGDVEAFFPANNATHQPSDEFP